MMRKYKRGDVVHIKKTLYYDEARSHFERDKDAIVLYSYASKYARNDPQSENEYGIMFIDSGRESSWYYGEDFKFLRHGGEKEIKKVKKATEKREKKETDLDWIIKNWKTLRKAVPGATMHKLMELVGITNPWGSHGEGITYYTNGRHTFDLLDPILLSGDKKEIKKVLGV